MWYHWSILIQTVLFINWAIAKWKAEMKDVLVFLAFLLPDLFPCIAVSLPVKLNTNNYKVLYCFHVKADRKRLFMNANTKTQVLPISYKLGFLAQGAQRGKEGSCSGRKRVLSLSSHRGTSRHVLYLQNNRITCTMSWWFIWCYWSHTVTAWNESGLVWSTPHTSILSLSPQGYKKLLTLLQP